MGNKADAALARGVPEEFAYFGTKVCGCTVAVAVDVPGHEVSTAESVGRFIRSGLRVERLPLAEVGRLKRCHCATATPAESTDSQDSQDTRAATRAPAAPPRPPKPRHFA